MKTFDHVSGKVFARDGAAIYYEETGNLEGPALVLLHGGFGSLEDFNPILPMIEPGYRIIGIDSRGQGRSTIGESLLSYKQIQNDVDALLTHLGVKEITLLGVSDGGIVAYRLAAYSSLPIVKLITIGSRWSGSNVKETREILSGVTAEGWKEKFPQTVELYERLNPTPDFERLVRQVVQMWLDEKCYPNEDVQNIKVPTLIIRGDNDHLTKRQFVVDVAARIYGAHLSNIAFAGHVVYDEQPEMLLKMINLFLKEE